MFEVLKGHTGSCQRRTCLKWEVNGELSALDRKNLMQLLCQVDKQACIDLDEADNADKDWSAHKRQKKGVSPSAIPPQRNARRI